MENNSKTHDMNIVNYLDFVLTDKWSVNGALGCVLTFFSQFLMSFANLSELIGVCTAVVGLAVAVLSFVKLYIQVEKERFMLKEFEEGRKDKDGNDIVKNEIK